MCFINFLSFGFGLCIFLFLGLFLLLVHVALGLWVCHGPKTPVPCVAPAMVKGHGAGWHLTRVCGGGGRGELDNLGL